MFLICSKYNDIHRFLSEEEQSRCFAATRFTRTRLLPSAYIFARDVGWLTATSR